MKDLVSSPNRFCRLMKARGPGTAWPGGGASSNCGRERGGREGRERGERERAYVTSSIIRKSKTCTHTYIVILFLCAYVQAILHVHLGVKI